MESFDSRWPDILDLVRQRVPKQAFDTWFQPLKPGKGEDGTLCVYCPNRFFMDWFSEHHLSTLNDALSAYYGRATTCRLHVNAQIEQSLDDMMPRSANAPGGAAAVLDPDVTADLPVQRHSRNGGAKLNADYTFDSFVVGSGTKLPHAAAIAVSNNPGGHFNPLFIHGGVGLGKTHLMHAIGNCILNKRPHIKIRYVTAEHFMNDLIFAIQRNRTYDFKSNYRNVDVLLVDDVAFLAGKESTQEEFFHTFNTLYNDKKQIVLTSDRSPKEITTLEERLRSRFEWGLITDIQPPDLETRIAILKKKVEINKIYMADDVIQYIAENITNNIRRLEGALIRLLAFAGLTGRDINLEMASEVLSSFFQVQSKGQVMIADVKRVVSKKLNVTVDQLESKRRTQDLALARQIAMYIARERVGASLNQIGRSFGNRDHTTVLHAYQKIKKKMDSDSHFRGTVKDIQDQL